MSGDVLPTIPSDSIIMLYLKKADYYIRSLDQNLACKVTLDGGSEENKNC